MFQVSTEDKRQVIDITDAVEGCLGAEANGAVIVSILHTTAALSTADLDPGTDLDLLDALAGLLPKGEWRHPHNPAHAPDHLLATLIGPSLSLAARDGQLVLGTWQRVILIELDGPRTRDVSVVFVPAG
jgi:secondary thiamine-phosphate synthase enzyme